MRATFAIIATVLTLGLAGAASAQVIDSGTVVRIDPQASVVILQDGRMYRATPNTVFLIGNRPSAFTALRPGESVVIQSGEPVVYREGRYIALPAAAPPTAVIAQAPPPATVALPATGVRQTIYGTIADVDRDGKIKVKTDRDSFEARVSQDALRQIRKGDNVVIDLTIGPPGSAFPR